jgi:hypothetical protein
MSDRSEVVQETASAVSVDEIWDAVEHTNDPVILCVLLTAAANEIVALRRAGLSWAAGEAIERHRADALAAALRKIEAPVLPRSVMSFKHWAQAIAYDALTSTTDADASPEAPVFGSVPAVKETR